MAADSIFSKYALFFINAATKTKIKKRQNQSFRAKEKIVPGLEAPIAENNVVKKNIQVTITYLLASSETNSFFPFLYHKYKPKTAASTKKVCAAAVAIRVRPVSYTHLMHHTARILHNIVRQFLFRLG